MKVRKPWPADGPGTEPWGVLRGARRRRYQEALLAWYRTRSRPLRIRTTTDPWALLVAEVMAQQTQIARVDERWSTFMARFPTPAALAEASPAAVLRAWSGLGYNRRAMHLRRTAQRIVAEHAGGVPADLEALEALPGVGPYTARAILATAFGEAVAPVDTNVRRVLTRVLGRSLTRGQLQAAADALVVGHEAATWTHASMELGATVCLSRRPRCGECPVARWCASAGMAGRSGRRPPEVADPRIADPPITDPPITDPPFELTNRWLRGRIVARLRELEDGAWVGLPAVIGRHDADAVAAAVAALERDGLLERRADGLVRLPSDVS